MTLSFVLSLLLLIVHSDQTVGLLVDPCCYAGKPGTTPLPSQTCLETVWQKEATALTPNVTMYPRDFVLTDQTGASVGLDPTPFVFLDDVTLPAGSDVEANTDHALVLNRVAWDDSVPNPCLTDSTPTFHGGFVALASQADNLTKAEVVVVSQTVIASPLTSLDSSVNGVASTGFVIGDYTGGTYVRVELASVVTDGTQVSCAIMSVVAGGVRTERFVDGIVLSNAAVNDEPHALELSFLLGSLVVTLDGDDVFRKPNLQSEVVTPNAEFGIFGATSTPDLLPLYETFAVYDARAQVCRSTCLGCADKPAGTEAWCGCCFNDCPSTRREECTANFGFCDEDFSSVSTGCFAPNDFCQLPPAPPPPPPATCDNGIMDGFESDVDCGGTTCPPCVTGLQCLTNDDCQSDSCACEVGSGKDDCFGNGTSPVCVSCSDEKQNQGETAVDCGGALCLACPTCFDGRKNGMETGVDCGDPACPAHSATCAQRCSNGRFDGDEEGLDCGGSDCDPCPTCFDGIKNQDEEFVDCGGVCAPCSEFCDSFADQACSVVCEDEGGLSGPCLCDRASGELTYSCVNSESACPADFTDECTAACYGQVEKRSTCDCTDGERVVSCLPPDVIVTPAPPSQLSDAEFCERHCEVPPAKTDNMWCECCARDCGGLLDSCVDAGFCDTICPERPDCAAFCTPVCAHGKCDGPPGGDGFCNCAGTIYTGVACQVCACKNLGSCGVDSDVQCECQFGFTGQLCETPPVITTTTPGTTSGPCETGPPSPGEDEMHTWLELAAPGAPAPAQSVAVNKYEDDDVRAGTLSIARQPTGNPFVDRDDLPGNPIRDGRCLEELPGVWFLGSAQDYGYEYGAQDAVAYFSPVMYLVATNIRDTDALSLPPPVQTSRNYTLCMRVYDEGVTGLTKAQVDDLLNGDDGGEGEGDDGAAKDEDSPTYSASSVGPLCLARYVGAPNYHWTCLQKFLFDGSTEGFACVTLEKVNMLVALVPTKYDGQNADDIVGDGEPSALDKVKDALAALTPLEIALIVGGVVLCLLCCLGFCIYSKRKNGKLTKAQEEEARRKAEERRKEEEAAYAAFAARATDDDKKKAEDAMKAPVPVPAPRGPRNTGSRREASASPSRGISVRSREEAARRGNRTVGIGTQSMEISRKPRGPDPTGQSVEMQRMPRNKGGAGGSRGAGSSSMAMAVASATSSYQPRRYIRESSGSEESSGSSDDDVQEQVAKIEFVNHSSGRKMFTVAGDAGASESSADDSLPVVSLATLRKEREGSGKDSKRDRSKDGSKRSRDSKRDRARDAKRAERERRATNSRRLDALVDQVDGSESEVSRSEARRSRSVGKGSSGSKSNSKRPGGGRRNRDSVVMDASDVVVEGGDGDNEYDWDQVVVVEG